MIVVAGNPLLSIAGEERLRKAFEQLELLVVHRHLPERHRPSSPTCVLPCHRQVRARRPQHRQHRHQSHRPFAQYTPAVVDAGAASASRSGGSPTALLQAMGRPSLLDDETPDPWAKWRHMLARRRHRPRRPAGRPARCTCCRPPAPGRFFDEQVHTADGRVDCCPPSFAEAIERCAALFAETARRAADAAAADPPSATSGCTTRGSPTCARMKRGGRDAQPAGDPPRPMPPRSGSPTATRSSWPATTARSTPSSRSTTT